MTPIFFMEIYQIT